MKKRSKDSHHLIPKTNGTHKVDALIACASLYAVQTVRIYL